MYNSVTSRQNFSKIRFIMKHRLSVYSFPPIFNENLDFIPFFANNNNKIISKTLKNPMSQQYSVTYSPHIIRKLKLKHILPIILHICHQFLTDFGFHANLKFVLR